MTHDCGSPLFFHWGCRFLEYSVDVSLLSSDFMVAYPGASYPELMCKQGRSYTCLLVDTHDEYLICIPFRSHIRHNNAYIFQNTQRSKHSRSGLDYTKVALIKDPKYIDQTANAIVDNDEFNEAMQNLPQIITDVTKYIDKYRHHVDGYAVLHPRAYARDYQFSTLPYFHDIMGLDAT